MKKRTETQQLYIDKYSLVVLSRKGKSDELEEDIIGLYEQKDKLYEKLEGFRG